MLDKQNLNSPNTTWRQPVVSFIPLENFMWANQTPEGLSQNQQAASLALVETLSLVVGDKNLTDQQCEAIVTGMQVVRVAIQSRQAVENQTAASDEVTKGTSIDERDINAFKRATYPQRLRLNQHNLGFLTNYLKFSLTKGNK